jgi:hypothetical protein
MSVEDIIQYAQENFGSQDGSPIGDFRPELPDWLSGRTVNGMQLDPRDEIEIDVGGIGVFEGDDYPPNPNIDSLAFYLPFHFYKTDWGIYIRALGIRRLADQLASRHIGISAVRWAYNVLLEHERMHFICELAASRLEVIEGSSIYGPYFKDGVACQHEEALSNASVFIKKPWGTSNGLIKATHSFMKRQGLGYEDFDKWLDRNFDQGKRTAVSYMPFSQSPKILPTEFLFEINKYEPPAHLIIDEPAPWLQVFRRFPKENGLQVYVYTDDHAPPHIHVDFLDGSNKKKNRYEWPTLTPLRDAPNLSTSNRRKLENYVNRYFVEIDAKIARVRWR